ncbi:MAG TPA: hypothetical protein VK939_05930 [Longimicrobiales bacterium]|nr:hypothetical protein [Longimicrobiales bacterium]
MSSTRAVCAVVISAMSLLATASCGDGEPAGPVPTAALVAGDYRAAQTVGAIIFTSTANGESIDWIAAGASLTLTLDLGGQLSGRLFMPGADENGGDFDENMAGTWRIEGGRIRFQQTADTFVRDMPFTFAGGALTGDATFDGVRVRLTLERQ